MTDDIEVKSPENDVPIGPGPLLVSAREKAGMSQQDIADKLFLKRVIIDDIENDRMDASKSLTFTKGYVRSYAKLVSLNVEEVLALFDAFHQKPQDDAKLQSFSRRVAKQAQDDRWMMVTYAILFLLVAAVVMWWFQQPKSNVGQQPAAQSSSQAQPQTNAVENNNEAPATVTDTLAPIAQESQQSVDTAISNIIQENNDVGQEEAENTLIKPSTDGQELAQEIVADEAAEFVSPLPQEASSTSEETATMVFTFEQDCWVNIKDASGEAIAYGVKSAGRVMQVSGIPPFDITMGAPHVVQISYNGEDIDMSSFTGREIGRLTLPRQE